MIDLAYPAAPPPADLLARALTEGQRLRRRRRLAAAVTVAAAVSGVLLVVDGPGARAPQRLATEPSSSPVPIEDLPKARGEGPPLQQFAAPGKLAGGTAPPSASRPATDEAIGSLHKVLEEDGHGSFLFTNQYAAVCLAHTEPGRPVPQTVECTPLPPLPAEGFAFTAVGANNAVTSSWVIGGLVRGPVTRIVVRTPAGDVVATLAPTEDPDLGTLFWAVLPYRQGSNDDFTPNVLPVLRQTLYRGSTPVFSCLLPDCLRATG